MRVIRTGVGLVMLLVMLMGLMPVRVSAGVQDFTITSFEGDYYLRRDASRRSTLNITEKITARFPLTDQNHGIERALPMTYHGHTVDLKLGAIEDQSGHARDYNTYISNNNLVLRIGDASTYVHGEQTYVLHYIVHDVINKFANHEELYWDTNGTDWQQSFGSVTARLHADPALAARYTGQSACYEGVAGATEHCIMHGETESDQLLTFKAARQLHPGENVTFVAGFQANTFVGYQKTLWQRLLPVLLITWFSLGAIGCMWAIVFAVRIWRRFGRSPQGRGIIVPEYLPPKNLSVLGSAAILKKQGAASTAQILDLAVRHYLKIYEVTVDAGWFRKRKSFELEVVHELKGLRVEELRLLDGLFGSRPSVGTRVVLDTLRNTFYQQNAELQKQVGRQVETDGWFINNRNQKRHYGLWGVTLLFAGSVLLNPGIAIGGLIVLLTALQLRPLTAEGVATRDYLKGLEMYMRLAEADRIRTMQSPQGAAKLAGVDITDSKQLLKLYERLLPYAVIFGIEKQWAASFAPLYQQSPEWYAGNWQQFNAAVFVASMGSFSTTTNNTFSPPSSSSSSGFSGGSSGGGGGGGGGGGW